MSELVIIRASALPRYSDCPRRSAAWLFWRDIEALGYLLRRLPRGIAATVGSSVHRGAEIVLKEKSQGALPSLDVSTDACRDYLTEELSRGETSFDETTPNRADAIRQGLGMTRLYYHKIAPLIQPLLVEQRLEATVADGVTLTGQPDTVAIEPNQIDDLKTGARSPGNFNAQIGAYSMLARSAGMTIERGVIDFIKRVAVGRPQPDPVRVIIPLAIAEQTANNVLRHIVDDLRVFRDGDERLKLTPGDPAAFLANPNSNLCSEKYCPAHGTSFCHEWQKSE